MTISTEISAGSKWRFWKTYLKGKYGPPSGAVARAGKARRKR